jgi:hypothetical protein
MRPRWRSRGREAIDPHRVRPQRSGGRRCETFLPREEWAQPRGRKSPLAPLRAGDRGAARTSRPNPPIERPHGAAPDPSREETVASRGAGDQGVTMAPWRETSHQHGGQMVLACVGRARSGRSWLPQRSRWRQIGKVQADRGRPALTGDFSGTEPARLPGIRLAPVEFPVRGHAPTEGAEAHQQLLPPGLEGDN